MNSKDYHQSDKKHYLQTFKRYPLVLEKGEGAKVWDIEGKQYIDALAGIGVNSLGHNHPVLVKAIQEQAASLIHVSNFYLTEPQARLSEELCKISGLDRVFMTNSGAESVEGAVKIARKYAYNQGRGGTIISMGGSFHGRTLATIAMGKQEQLNGFGPIPEGFKQVPFNDLNALKAEVNKDIAAIIIEPVQGEGGVNVADRQFVKDLRALCNDQNIVLIFDEVQSGMGRTGKWFAKDHYEVQPDIMTLAKGLGGGVPVGAVLSGEKISEAMDFGEHGTTFGGNPLACSSSLAVINFIRKEDLLEQVSDKGEWIREKLQDVAKKESSIKQVRGMGMMIGIEFGFDTKPLVLEMMKNGVLANSTAGNILRLLPPFVITYEELECVVEVLIKSLKTVKENG